MIPNISKWVVAAIVVLWLPVTSIALPIFFVDQIYKSIDQLDEALAAGEITGEEYEAFYDMLLGNWQSDVDDAYSQQVIAMDIAPYLKPDEAIRPLHFYYKQISKFGLSDDKTTGRIDKTLVWNYRLLFSIEAEERTSASYVVRDRCITWMPHHNIKVGIGSYASSLRLLPTRPAILSSLNRQRNFGESLLFPSKARQNGAFADYALGPNRASAYFSHLEGSRHFRTSTGIAFSRQSSGYKCGIGYVRQTLGEFGGRDKVSHYLSPSGTFIAGGITLTGDLSTAPGNGAAGAVSFKKVTHRRITYEIIAFSYGRNYRNVESGGYAYADYGTTEIPEIDFKYSDKRTGRRGIAVETEYRSRANYKIRSELVRWRNVLEDRDCIAARLNWSWKDPYTLAFVRTLRLQGIWEDFDLATSAADSRKWLTAGSELKLSAMLSTESLIRVGLRTLNGSDREEWRARQEFEAKLRNYLRVGVAFDWRDSDWGSGGNEKLLLSLTERYANDNGNAVAITVQSRYYPDRGQVDDWEVRLDTKLLY